MRRGFVWGRLTADERRELMALQMAPSGGSMGGGGYLPEDCSECRACGQPMLGYPGMCSACYRRWDALVTKGCTP